MKKQKSWDEYRQEAAEKRNEERKQLLALNDAEAENLPIPARYQRIRYHREIEAATWLAEIRRTLPLPQEDAPLKKRKSYKTMIVKNNWID